MSKQSLQAEMYNVNDSLGIPEEFAALRRRVFEDIARSGTAPGLPVGEKAPDFVLPNATGGTTSLAQALSRGPVVLSFYRGGWCPFCNTELAALQQSAKAIQGLGATLIAVSPQPIGEAQALKQSLDLSFDLLSDADQSVIRKYRLQFELPADFREQHLGFGIDLATLNADGSWRLPVPGTFILDRDGVIRARHVSPDFLYRMEPEDILTALRTLK